MSPGDDLARVCALVTERLGLVLDAARLEDLRDVVHERLPRAGARDLAGYAVLLEGPRGRDELRAIAERVTVGETYFFRNQAQLEAFTQVMLPRRAEAAAARGELSLLSAGCASGEEPYTLALLVGEHLPLPSARVSILGLDVNPAAIARARRAAYSEWSLRQVQPDARRRDFRAVGRELHLESSARSLVTFEERNLTEDDPAFWRPGRFDVVFFRNVGMYLTPAAYRQVISRLARALAPGGFLVLGDAETLRGVSVEFDLRHTHDSFYYQRREAGAGAAAPASTLAAPARPAAEAPRAEAPRAEAAGRAPALDATWVEAIGQAARRVAELTARASDAPARDDDGWDLGPARELLRQERLEAALQALEALPADAHLDPEFLLLQAVALINRGHVARARGACDELLAIDGLSAGAHYVRALCDEHDGDVDAAAEHDLTAAYLDPTFAMPRLHLGLLARRAGRAGDARREFERALELLRREDDARLLLHGGGFTREALLALCRGELRRTGGVA